MIAPLILLAALASVPVCTGSDYPFQCKDRDVLIHNARIWTGEVDAPVFHEAMLLRGGKVVAVGPVTQVERLARANRYTVNLGGRTVLPGLIDGHGHVAMLIKPEWLVGPDPSSWAPGAGPTASEFQAWVAARAAVNPVGQPIVFFYGGAFYKTANEMGTTARALLDTVTTQHPVFGIEWSGHVQALNSVALEEAGVRDYQPDPFTGWHGRDELGRLNGILQELAMLPAVYQISRRISDADYVAQYNFYDAGALARGTVLTGDIRFVFTEARAERIRRMAARPSSMMPIGIITQPGQLIAPGPDGVVRRKIFADGTHVACSAHVTTPYLAYETCPAGFSGINDGYGIQNNTDDQIDWALSDTLTRGGQLLVHAIGDAGIEQILSRLEARPTVDWRGRVTIEHYDQATSNQVVRTRALGIAVVQNPSHLYVIGSLMRDRLESSEYEHAQPLKTLVETGVPLALASDAFGPAAPNLWQDVLWAVTHPYRPSEALTLPQTLAAMTREAARARLLPNLGTLSPGKSATFFVATQDPFSVTPAALPSVASCLTVVDGKTEWADRSCW